MKIEANRNIDGEWEYTVDGRRVYGLADSRLNRADSIRVSIRTMTGWKERCVRGFRFVRQGDRDLPPSLLDDPLALAERIAANEVYRSEIIAHLRAMECMTDEDFVAFRWQSPDGDGAKDFELPAFEVMPRGDIAEFRRIA